MTMASQAPWHSNPRVVTRSTLRPGRSPPNSQALILRPPCDGAPAPPQRRPRRWPNQHPPPMGRRAMGQQAARSPSRILPGRRTGFGASLQPGPRVPSFRPDGGLAVQSFKSPVFLLSLCGRRRAGRKGEHAAEPRPAPLPNMARARGPRANIAPGTAPEPKRPRGAGRTPRPTAPPASIRARPGPAGSGHRCRRGRWVRTRMIFSFTSDGQVVHARQAREGQLVDVL